MDEITKIYPNEEKVPKYRMIKFGEEFEKWSTTRQMNYLKKLASSMNHAAYVMQQERNALAEEVVLAKEQVVNAETSLAIQKKIVFKSITDTNQAKEDYINRIQVLEGKLRDRESDIDMLQEQLAGNVPS